MEQYFWEKVFPSDPLEEIHCTQGKANRHSSLRKTSPSPFHTTSKTSSITIRNKIFVSLSVNTVVLESPTILRWQPKTSSPDGVKTCPKCKVKSRKRPKL